MLPEPEILRLVAEREQFRQQRRFNESDAIREQLRGHGVELYDKEKEWRASDGRRGFLFTAGATHCQLSDVEIEEQVCMREEARKNKEFVTADRIRDDLRANGVELNDRDAIWQTSAGRSGFYSEAGQASISSWSNSKDGGDNHSRKRARVDDYGIAEHEILRLVAEREHCRQQRRFEESDAIREQLRAQGVELYDKEKEWRASDGRRGFLFTAGPAECHLSDAEIQEQVRQREDARRNKDFDTADRIRDDLRASGVELNDKEAAWQTGSGRQGLYSGASPALSRSVPGSQIRKLVAERERCRTAQDFDAADDIRRQLSQLGVELFDSERVWRSRDGQQGVIITGGHEVDCRFTYWEIMTKVGQREEARSSKDWGNADAIRDDLRRNGVELLDGPKQWCTTDGRHGNYADAGRGEGPHGRQHPLPSAPPPLSHAAPQVAPHHVPSRHPQVLPLPVIGAPPPLQGSTLGGYASERGHSVGQGAPQGDSLSDASIEALVLGREQRREMRDFAGADAIRSDLKANGVEVWDKDRMWKASDGRSGPIKRPS